MNENKGIDTPDDPGEKKETSNGFIPVTGPGPIGIETGATPGDNEGAEIAPKSDKE